MLTPEEIEVMDKVTGWGSVPTQPVAGATPSKPSRGDEIRALIQQADRNKNLGARVSETVTEAGDEYQKTVTGAELRQEAGQQGAVSTFVQKAGAAAKAGTKTVFAPATAVIGAGIDSIAGIVSAGREAQKKADDAAIAAGTLDPADAISRSPKFEDMLKESATAVFEKFKTQREKDKLANPEKKDLIDLYQESSDTTKANIKAVTDVGSAALDVAGGIVGKKAATKAGEKLVSKGLEFKVASDLGDFNPKIIKNKIMDKTIDKVEAKYQELAGSTLSGTRKLAKGEKVTEMKNAAGTVGKTPERTLAEDGILPKSENGKLSTRPQAEEYRTSIEPLQEINKDAIRSVSTKVPQINLNEERKIALSMANSSENVNKGLAGGLTKEINAEYDNLIENLGENIDLNRLNEIKSARMSQVKFDSTRPLKGDADYIIGKTAQKTIEDVTTKAGYGEVAQLNRHIGDKLEAAKFLEGLDGRAVKGNRLTRLAISMTAASMGSSIPTSVAMAFGADYVARLMIGASVAGPVKRLIMARLEKTDPKAFQVAVKWLKDQGVMKDVQLALPPRSAVGTVPAKNGVIKVAPAGSAGKFEGTGKEPMVTN